MMTSKFKGTGVAIVTPFRKDKSIDFKSLEKLIRHLLDNKIEYLVVLGTTGESVTLGKDEKRAVIDFVIEQVQGKVPIVAGFGGNNTQEVINTLKSNHFDGIDGILSVCPYYNKPTQEGIYEHYKTIAAASPVPVILYNVPGRTGVNMCPETVLKLAHDSSKIIAVKEASGNLDQITRIIRDKPEGFQVISGDDGMIIPLVASGGAGVISVAANAFPLEISTLTRLILNNEIEKAREINDMFLDIFPLLFEEGNPAGVKAFLKTMGITDNYLRLPLTPVSKQLQGQIVKIYKDFKFNPKKYE
ncbi:MAG: 4-hydroxy-tetrahydrodipicolinate synthase [Bacteroidales bacterium]